MSIPDRVLFETVREAPLEKFRDRRLREVKSVGTVGGESEQTDGSIDPTQLAIEAKSDSDGIWLPANQLQLQGGAIRDYAEPGGPKGGHKVNGSLPPNTLTDATLSDLTLSGVTLSPAFAADVETYTATVVNSVMQTTVTATKNDDGATVAIAGNTDTSTPNTVTVTAEDGTTT